MKIRLLSDLHTEFRLPYKTHKLSEYRGEDVVVLAGDIASGSTNTYEVLKHFSEIFPRVIYVAGNHEYYGTSFNDFNNKLQDKCLKLDNVHFLRRNAINIKDVWFIGATLWTNFNKSPISEQVSRRMIADFRYIKDWQTSDAIEQYYLDREYIKMAYNAFPGKKIIITHFLPAQECVSPRFRGDPTGVNDYFANNLGNWIHDLEDTTWMFGHTHDTVDTYIGKTRLVANPHGYYNSMDEGKDFDPHKIIEV